jgi:hypothetical protein
VVYSQRLAINVHLILGFAPTCAKLNRKEESMLTKILKEDIIPVSKLMEDQ